MAHATGNGVTVAHAVEYHPAAEKATARRLDATLRRAERLVRALAPPPDPLDAVRAASDEDLLAVTGIGSKRLEKIREG